MPEVTSYSLLKNFGTIRFKARPKETWTKLWQGLGSDFVDPSSVVFVALEDLGRHNGFFMELAKGDDICVDRCPEIFFPNTGGGLAIKFDLRL